MRDQAIKGTCDSEARKYIDGTDFITKWTVERHLKSKSHDIAVKQEKLVGEKTATITSDVTAGPSSTVSVHCLYDSR